MTPASSLWIALDRAAGDLEGQIYRVLRERILQGQMAPGQQLPSTRALAGALRVARSTVVNAYERLKAEGYLEATMGAKSRVAAFDPSVSHHFHSQSAARFSETALAPALPEHDPQSLPVSVDFDPPSDGALAPGVPDLAGFPHAAWARCLGARARALRVHDLGYGAACGLPELQRAVVDHVAATRGVAARAEQVLVVPSTGAALDLLARLLLRPDRVEGDVAWVEEPGYRSAQILLRAAGARLIPVPCDRAGIDPAKADGPAPRLIYVTPSHQYPTGVTMSLQRRLALLERARACGAVILEDDYDSEFQYGSRPIAALQGIDRGEVVAYLGTFSKILAPGLRVAYAILPRWLVPEVAMAARLRGSVVPIHVQAALADFIRDGYLRAHIRRMTAAYAARMRAIVTALRFHCGDCLDVSDGTGGLQLASWFLNAAVDDRACARFLRTQGFGLQAMSDFYLATSRPGLLLGIARLPPEAADGAARKIRRLLDEFFSAPA